MTPTELETYVRQRYNAVGDNFYPQALIFNYFYDAEMELARKTKCIQRVYSTTTVASQRAYDVPSLSHAIARVEYDGERLQPNDFVDDDSMTGGNADETITGRPTHYQQFADSIYLRPVPSEADTLKIFSYDMPSAPTAAGTLDVPVRYHVMLADYALYCMAFQDKNYAEADRFKNKWMDNVKEALATEREKRSADAFNTVKDWSDQVEPRFI